MTHPPREPETAIPGAIMDTARLVWIEALDDGSPDAAAIIAKAINDAVMAERERCDGIAQADYERRFSKHRLVYLAVTIEKGIKADFLFTPKAGG